MSNNSKLFNKDGKEYPITSPYGMRTLVVNGKDVSGYHIGTDYGYPQGTPIVLPVDVEIIGVNTGHSDYGGHVFAYNKHFNGTFNPAHMSRIDVKKGDVVKAGTVIGLSGGAKGTVGAGLSTGSHLHIGFYAKGKKTNTGKGEMGDGGWINIATFDFTIKPAFKPYQYTIPAKTYLYKADGTQYPAPTTREHKVTIIKENPNLNQGLFKASWLRGTDEAWVKLNIKNVNKYEPKVGDYVVPTKLEDFQGRKLTQFDKLYQITAKDSRGYTLSAVRGKLRPIWAILPKSNFKESK